MDAEELIKTVADLARDKKAKDILILDMRGISSLADYFFLCSTENTRQSRAIVEEVAVRLKKSGVRATRTEGFPEGSWIVMDYGLVLIHVFLDEAREHYSLETLWGDAPHLILPPGK